MFRLVKAKQYDDPTFPHDLKELGYFLNEDDEIRSIDDPAKPMTFKFSRSERINEVRAEAFNACTRKIVSERLHSLGMEILRLPISNPPLSPTQPHVPILVSENCTKATKRLIVLLNNTSAELGIISPRYASALGHGGIAAGSAVNLVKHIRGLRALDSPDQPAILIANLGQLLWHRRAKQAVGRHQWDAMARKVPECPAATIYTEKNTIPGNRTPTDHIRHVLTKVVPEILGPEGKVQIIACFDAGWDLIDVLAENWTQLAPRLDAVAWLDSFYNLENHVEYPEMLDFIGRRSRAYRMTDDSSVKRDLDFIPSPTSSNGPFFDPSMQSVFDNDESYRLGCPTYSCPNPTRKPGIVDKATGKDVNLFFQECGLCSWGGLVMGFLEEAWQKGDRLEQPSIEPIVTTPDPSETSTPDDDGSGDERSGW